MNFRLIVLLGRLPAVFAAFGVATSSSSMIVDSGAGLFTTSKDVELVLRLCPLIFQ